MLNRLKSIFTVDNNDDNNSITDEEKVKIATCALFMEIADSDDNFSEVEKNLIVKLLKNQFYLEDDEVDELINLSKQKIKESVSFYEYTDIINQNFSKEEKLKVVESLWKIIYSDGVLDKYEDYFIKKISGNLHLDHSDLIAAKLSAKNNN